MTLKESDDFREQLSVDINEPLMASERGLPQNGENVRQYEMKRRNI